MSTVGVRGRPSASKSSKHASQDGGTCLDERFASEVPNMKNDSKDKISNAKQQIKPQGGFTAIPVASLKMVTGGARTCFCAKQPQM